MHLIQLKRWLRASALLGLFALLQGLWLASEAQAASAAEALKEDAVCTRCHDYTEAQPVLSIYQTRHGVRGDARTPSCQSCHGASEKHLKGDPNQSGRAATDVQFGKHGVYPQSSPEACADSCLQCHKGEARSHWAGSQHEGAQMACSDCHKVHVRRDPVLAKATQPEVCYACHQEQRAQTHRLSTHPLAAGQMACSDCHNPHGSTVKHLLVQRTVNETCYTCHAEKRGPFLWEHGPVADDCTNCHTPHGSVNPALLKQRTPWLCQDCHSGDHSNQVNSGANLQGGDVTTARGNAPLANAAARAQLGARNCMNCHVLVHGSNHPAGSKYMR
jgi:DmsE family decaheme c-type cytochrome